MSNMLSNTLDGNEDITDDSVMEGINFLKVGDKIYEKLHKDGDDKTEAWGDNYYFPTEGEIQDYRFSAIVTLKPLTQLLCNNSSEAELFERFRVRDFQPITKLYCYDGSVMKLNRPAPAPVMK